MLCFEVTEIKTAFLYSEISSKVDFVSKYFIKSFSYCGGGGTRTEEPSVVSRMLSPLYYGYASSWFYLFEIFSEGIARPVQLKVQIMGPFISDMRQR